MNRSLEAVLESARARPVPWDAERSARVERGISKRRVRSASAASIARWTIGALASSALYVGVLHVSHLTRTAGADAQRLEEPAAALQAPPEAEPFAERPVGDGGFD